MQPKTLESAGRICERPEARAMIIEQGLMPDIVRETHMGRLYWDSMSARDATGKRRLFGVGQPKRIHLELKKMAYDGYWGDLKGVILSWHRYSLLRDVIDGKIRGSSLSASLWWPSNHANGDRQVRK